jgi:O-antigen/teichoic acid export membrane protein
MRDLKKTLYLGLGLGIKLITGLFAVKICAQLLGPEGFGLTGQLSSLLSVVSLVAGAGISAGITKIYAGPEFLLESRPQWVRVAFWIAMISAALLIVLALVFSGTLVQNLFGGIGESAYWLIWGLVISTLPIAFANIAQGKINGSHRDDLYALSLACSSLVGFLGLLLLAHFLGSIGALLGMIWLIISQALGMNFFGMFADKRGPSPHPVKVIDFSLKARFLLSYGALSIAAGAIIPIVYIAIRILIKQYEGDSILGLWQATLRISEAYSQLPLLFISAVLFPRFVASASAPLDKSEVRNTYLFMVGVMSSIAGFVYLTCDYWIPIVFTAQFKEMEFFMPWQLGGDTLRILCYVGTVILAARGKVKLCFVGECMQGGLLLASSFILVPRFPIYGAFYAYILTYSLYFIITYYVLLRQNINASS